MGFGLYVRLNARLRRWVSLNIGSELGNGIICSKIWRDLGRDC